MQIAILWLACAAPAGCLLRCAGSGRRQHSPKAGLPPALQLDPALLHSTWERHGSHEGLLQVGGCRHFASALLHPAHRHLRSKLHAARSASCPLAAAAPACDIIRPSPPPAGTVGGSSLWHAHPFLLCPACPSPRAPHGPNRCSGIPAAPHALAFELRTARTDARASRPAVPPPHRRSRPSRPPPRCSSRSSCRAGWSCSTAR